MNPLYFHRIPKEFEFLRSGFYIFPGKYLTYNVQMRCSNVLSMAYDKVQIICVAMDQKYRYYFAGLNCHVMVTCDIAVIRGCLTIVGAAVAEWLSSWLAEQEDRGSIPGLATWIFRDWLSPASKSRYGWKIAKSTLILKTTNQPTNQPPN